MANGVRVTQSYDAVGRVVGVNTNGPAGLVRRLTYTLDTLGRRTVVAASDGARTTYTYDPAGQLVRERKATTGLDVTHVYDPAGNRTRVIDSGTRPTFSYDAASQLTLARTGLARTTYTNDAVGNRTRKDAPAATTFYSWDSKSRLVAAEPVAGVVSYSYDGGDRQVIRESGGASVRTVYDFEKVLQEVDGSSGVTEQQYLATDRVFGDLVSGYGSGQTRYYGFDALGSTEELLNDAGAVTGQLAYEAFGEVQQATGSGASEPFAWVGKQGYRRDTETELFLLGSGSGGRYYDPATVRFLSRDPIEFLSDTNLYRYAANNPVNEIDPSGQQILSSVDTSCCMQPNLGWFPRLPWVGFANESSYRLSQLGSWQTPSPISSPQGSEGFDNLPQLQSGASGPFAYFKTQGPVATFVNPKTPLPLQVAFENTCDPSVYFVITVVVSSRGTIDQSRLLMKSGDTATIVYTPLVESLAYNDISLSLIPQRLNGAAFAA